MFPVPNDGDAETVDVRQNAATLRSTMLENH